MDLQQLVGENQTIKIVPSIEDSLRTSGLNVDLDENTFNWFQHLKHTWKTWKKSTTIENHILQFFNSVEDPYRLSLVFIVKCGEIKDCKPKSLPFFIIETLQKWSKLSSRNPEESLKLPAFHIGILQRNHIFLRLILITYKVFSIKNLVLPIIKNMLKNDNCKQASQVVIAMDLFEDIPVEDLLFPLILQDKGTMVDEYLSECPSQVKPLLLFLDKLLDKKFNLREYVQKFIEENRITQVKYDRLHRKPLGKLVGRLCKKYNIPIETCNNLSRNRTTCGLRYLVHKKYQEHNISASEWDDLVKDSLRQNADSANEFIDILVDYDIHEAKKWATYLNIHESNLPLALKEMPLQEEPTENWDIGLNTSNNYYKSSLSDSCIVIIDTAEKFYDLLATHLPGHNVISIDCEWKPSFGAKELQIALIQIATLNYVYLIDTITLNQEEYLSFWYKFNKSLLSNAEIIKLGFGLEQDLKEIKGSIIGLSNINVHGEGLLDLALLWKSLINLGLQIPNSSDNGGNSLSSLVECCFGLPLQKTEQCSNWELRPLRTTQMQYAALDAYVLIEIYHYLEKLSQEQEINFEEICNDIMLEKRKKPPKKKVADRLVMSLHCPQPSKVEWKSAQNVRFLVEPNLSYMISYLRYCGMDTTVMSSFMLWHNVIDTAISEDRLILVIKPKSTPTANFAQSSILDVGKGSVKVQLQKVINTYHINVQQNDLLSRCITCNARDLKKLTPVDVMNLLKDFNKPESQNSNDRNYYEDLEEDDYINNFLCDSDCDEDLYQPITAIKDKKICITSKGVPIDINDLQRLSSSKESVMLCETCGKLYWEGEELLRSVSNVVLNLLKLNT